MALYEYVKQVQRFLRDTSEQMVDYYDIVQYVNRARREIALQTQCVRVNPPIQGQVASITINSGGTGYSANPTVTISAPDSPSGLAGTPGGAQATISVGVVGGVITSAAVEYGGDGYFQPVITITDPTGTGASLTAVTTPIMTLNQNQETYAFSAIPLGNFPGVKEVFAVKSACVIYSNYRYMLRRYAFSEYQAKVRQYPHQYYYVPTICSQYGQGAGGTLYTYPIASQTYQFDLDCFCLPLDLTADGDPEAIPDPWTDAVPWYAAHLAYLELQNLNAAKFYYDMYINMLHRYSSAARVGYANNRYGRY